MGLKKVSFYKISNGPGKSGASEPIPITFNPALENWAFSVALTRIFVPVDSPIAPIPPPSLYVVAASVTLESDRFPYPVSVTHGTSEEYGTLTSLQFTLVAESKIEVDALLTVYEYEPIEYERLPGPAGRGELPKAF